MSDKFVRIDDLIAQLQEIKNKEGNLVVCINDEMVGFVPSIAAVIYQTEGYKEEGFFSQKEGNQKICVIDFSPS